MRVKGSAFRQVIDTWVELRGRAFADQALASLEGPAGEALRHGAVIASGMYAVGWYGALVREGAETSADPAAFAHEVGRRSTERDIGTLHRLLFRALSVETIVNQVPRLLGLYFEGGRGQVVVAAPGRIRLTFEAFHGFDEYLWRDLAGACEAMLAATGVFATKATVIEGGLADRAVVELTYSSTAP